MTTKKSHGKARTELPRSGTLRPVETARDPAEGRGAGGRFGRGNQIARGSGEKNAVRKLLGRRAGEEEVTIVARDAGRLFGGVMRQLPDDGPIVRTLVALLARHGSVAGFYNARADAAGLETAEGRELAELAMKHGQRVERLTVTALDVATRLAAKAERPAAIDLSALRARQRARAEAEGDDDTGTEDGPVRAQDDGQGDEGAGAASKGPSRGEDAPDGQAGAADDAADTRRPT